MKKLILLSLAFIQVATANTWVDDLYLSSVRNILNNISRSDTPKGFIVASPSKYEPNYYYHWVRDAALVMNAMSSVFKDQEKFVFFNDYVQLVSHHQKVSKLTNQGEPKFNPDGTSFKGPWGRPQNDGPALRIITLVDFAFEQIEKGNTAYVTKYLYGSKIPANSVIKRDLEYVSHHWQESDFDLWEEVKGTHFYTRMAQRLALIKGAKLARKLKDYGAANWYDSQARLINKSLDEHWSDNSGYILTTLNRVGGLDYKYSNLDTSVILAVNHSGNDNYSFSHDDSRVMASFEKIISSFKKIYPINKNSVGVALGRYPEDQYFGGNPWFLLTNAASEYLYKLKKSIDYRGIVKVDHINKAFFKEILGLELPTGLIEDEALLKTIKSNINKEAYNYILKTKKHMDPNGRMDEQFSKYNGYMIGARDLTWSYASFISLYNSI